MLIFILILIVLIYNFSSKSSFIPGYSSKEDPYIKPAIYPNLITKEEADYILAKANDSFSDSIILSGNNNSIRKSKTAWLYKTDSVINKLYERISKILNFDIDKAEALQVVKYEPGGFYNEHHDSCCETGDICERFIAETGQRTMTILIYLNDDFEGGATSFPELKMELKAPKYGAIVFHPLEKDGDRCHPLALHKGMPVTSGKKFISNIWIREKKYK